MKKIILILLAIICLGLATTLVFIFTQTRQQELEIVEQEKVLDSLQEELARLKAQEESLTKKNKKLLSDLVASLDANNKLRKENKELKDKLTTAEKKIEKLETDIKKIEKKQTEREKAVKEEKGEKPREELLSEIAELQEKNEKVKEENENLKEMLKQEKAAHHYNLGVMYTKNKEYDKAISEFKESLENDPKNADAYYNLGFLYREEKNNPLNSAVYYRKYLELNPEAKDAEKVKGFISDLLFQEDYPSQEE